MKTVPCSAVIDGFDPGGGLTRDAIGLGRVAENLDVRHGTILSLEDINVSFDGFKALTNLSLYIGVGELRCIIGPNGAGKTTMMDVITGKTRPTSGSAWFGETLDLTRMSEVDIAQAGIGRKFQKPTVFEALSVFETWSWRRRPTSRCGPASGPGFPASRRTASTKCWRPSASASRVIARPGCCPTGRSSSSRSACC